MLFMSKVQPLCRSVVACSLFNGREWRALNCDGDTLTAASWVLGFAYPQTLAWG